MQDFNDKIGVVTGGGTGIGREITRQLVAEGCHVGICDVIATSLEETIELCSRNNPLSVNVTGFVCDVADELQVKRFCQDVRDRHSTDYINLLVNNAGISGGGSFVESTREEWERTFNICWSGVYLVTRTFMPLLLNSTEGHL
ncbi:MAG: SDR family NAD(P)-dependent oxidoreductase, partial [Gammaproteobacteria bacterium]|nr:SDR family NAD(P)-dependent oxidoreductase [Gammaproteobacteria bacterium]